MNVVETLVAAKIALRELTMPKPELYPKVDWLVTEINRNLREIAEAEEDECSYDILSSFH